MGPLHRYDAHATIVPDEWQTIIGGRIGLLRLVLTDDGPLTDPDTDRLHALADQLPTTTTDSARATR
jgi:hypothetical protein